MRLVAILGVDRDTVSVWLDAWETRGLRGLYDGPRTGRPPRLAAADRQWLSTQLCEQPQPLQQVRERLRSARGKGWQPRGQTWRLPAHDFKRLTIMGFFSRDHRHDLHLLEERVNSRTVIDLIDGFIQRRAHPQRFALIVLDNASIHTSVLFNAQLERWLRQRVIVYWLPTYSPELNRIEILWRKTQYRTKIITD